MRAGDFACATVLFFYTVYVSVSGDVAAKRRPLYRRAVSLRTTLVLVPLVLAAGASSQGLGCAGPGSAGNPGEAPDGSGDNQGVDGSSGGQALDGGGGQGDGDAASVEPNLCPANGVGIPIFGAACDAGSPTIDWSPLRRISRVEYDDMVRDLLGDTTQPAKQFVSETPLTSNGINFWTNTCAGVGAGDLAVPQQYLQAAETLAQTAIGEPNLTNLLNQYGLNSTCNARGDACAQGFVSAVANLAFRGQFAATEGASLFQNDYTPIASQFDFPTGMQANNTAVHTSPRFLYVHEFGDVAAPGPVIALSPTEVAARLALFLWRSVPDTTLLAAASSGQLSTPAQIAAQATRMLTATGMHSGGPLAQGALDDFATQWMELESAGALTKDPQYVMWNGNATLSTELVEETLTTFHSTVLGQPPSTGGSLTDLLTSTSSYANADVATFYGVPGATSSYTKTVVASPTNPRSGILTDAIVLAAQSHTSFPSPTLRGKLIRQQVLCDAIDPPPPTANTSPPSDVAAGSTIKEQYAAHGVGSCAACHDLMDPIGDAFGVYDATGAYQTTEADGRDGGPFAPIDPTGVVNAAAAGEFAATATGPVDLVTQMAGATQTKECFALQQFRYALSRIETPSDACSIQGVYQAFAAGQLNIQTLLLAIVQSDAFLYRSAQTPGSSCQ